MNSGNVLLLGGAGFLAGILRARCRLRARQHTRMYESQQTMGSETEGWDIFFLLYTAHLRAMICLRTRQFYDVI